MTVSPAAKPVGIKLTIALPAASVVTDNAVGRATVELDTVPLTERVLLHHAAVTDEVTATVTTSPALAAGVVAVSLTSN